MQMDQVAISVKGLGKEFTLGQSKEKELRHSLTNIFRRLLPSNAQAKESFWALKDVSFEVKKGEAMGVLGRNGAGKSTLLKILSRITEPSLGRFEINGRVSSLLEVGTGFHPELTGRENVFLNGTILGMKRAEVKAKFEEIVEFSGVRKFIDTPVKRYSSGMKVRLAFAVAAHLEPEILIIDEVLAVGDAEFQKKCLGKMEDVAGQGRTVLFVSHNMAALEALCPKAILIENGQLVSQGDTSEVIKKYLGTDVETNKSVSWDSVEEKPGNKQVTIEEITIVKDTDSLKVTDNFALKFSFSTHVAMELNLSVTLWNAQGACVMCLASEVKKLSPNAYSSTLEFPANLLNNDTYYIDLLFVKDKHEVIFTLDKCFTFEIEDSLRDSFWNGKWNGVVRPNLKFLMESR